MSETTRSRPRLDYSALLRSAKATPKPGFSGWWSYIEFQPDIFSPQRFPIGVVVQADDERLYFKLLDDFKKFDCVYPEGFPHSSAKALMAYAYGVLQAAIKEKTPLSQILFDSHVLSLSRPVHTSGSDREAARLCENPLTARKPSLTANSVEFTDILNAEVNMSRYIEGQDRQQVTLLPECLDDFISEDNTVRIVDAFINFSAISDGTKS
jgi:hypothetical protein